MERAELRNEQPDIMKRPIELLIYGVFAAFEGDKGYHSTGTMC